MTIRREPLSLNFRVQPPKLSPASVRLRDGRRQGVFSLLLFALLAFARPGPAAEWKQVEPGEPGTPINAFVHISDDEGLLHSDVRAIAQDQQGFLWFGLRLGGLTRYDGHELKLHQHDPKNPHTLGNRIIWCLLIDRTGTLWIGTEGGLDRYDRAAGVFAHYRSNPENPHSLPNNFVTSLMEDSAGRIWVGTRRGLARLDDPAMGKFTTFVRPPPIPGSTAPNTFRSIMEDPTTGLFWLGTSDGIAAFDPRTGKFASFIEEEGQPDSLTRNSVNEVIKSPSGEFWALTEWGLNRFTSSLARIDADAVQSPRLSFRRYTAKAHAAAPGMNYLRDGLFDKKGRLWMASRGGVILFDPEREVFVRYGRDPAVPGSLNDDLAQTIFEDRTGNIWVGTFAGGVSRLRSESKRFFVHRHIPGNAQSLSDDRISGIGLDTAGRLWAATTNGLNVLEQGVWRRFANEPGDPKSPVTNNFSTLATSSDGVVWMGSNYSGLHRYDGTRFQAFPHTSSNAPVPHGWHAFTGEQVNSLLADDKGGLWVGARSYGLDYHVDGRFLHFGPRTENGSVTQPTINPILGVLHGNALWYGTERDGLARLDLATQTFTSFPLPGERGSRSLLCISSTPGTIWLGAADGLLKFDLKTLSFVGEYTVKQGLPHDAVMTIVVDARGHLWLGTANGLGDFDPQTGLTRVYEKPDGLPSNVFSQRCGLAGPDGRIYMGTRSGILAFVPEELKDNPTPPTVVVTELHWIGPAPKSSRSTADGEVLDVGERVVVPPGQLGFTLKFSALDFTAPEKNRYRYRLEGWENEWMNVNARERNATYTALPPGHYTFRVQASNSDGAWNEQGATLNVIVQPFLWQTMWFRVLAILSVLALVVAGLQRRTLRIRHRNALLETQVSQRTAQLQEEIAVRQRAEAALRQSHAELEDRVQARTAELAKANVTLQAEVAERKSIEAQLRQSQKMEAIGQLAGGVAHDFNNLLTVILGQIELVGDKTVAPEVRESAIRDINAAAQRATNLTRQLLVFSRHQAVSPSAIDLNEVVGGVTKLFGHLIGAQISLQTKLAPQTLGVLGDTGMLEQVLLNLVVNARDAMSRGGTLTISTDLVDLKEPKPTNTGTAKPGTYACCCVTDTGHGIAAEVLPQIFEPFFTTKESGKGTGLGLAITLGIVQQHGGWIEVSTQQGTGTTFCVYLPSHSTRAIPAPRPASNPPIPTTTATILLVEDEPAVRRVLKQMLTRQGHRVLETGNGGEALEVWALEHDHIDLLITDIVMPGPLDGHALAARLQKLKPTLRVMTMSGHDPSEFAGAARAPNGNPHLRKPFTADELLRGLRQALGT